MRRDTPPFLMDRLAFALLYVIVLQVMSFNPSSSRYLKVHGGKLRRPLYVSRLGVKMQPKKTLARKVAVLSRKVKDNDELKFFDTALSFAVDATLEIPATGQLSLIPQNDTQSGRDGRKANVESIWIRFQSNYTTPASAPAAPTNSISYIWLILDRQCNGAAATVANDNTGIFTAGSAPTVMQVLANTDRFKIIKKFVVRSLLDGSAHQSANTSQQVNYYEAYIKTKFSIEFDGSAADGSLATIRSNNLFLVAGSDTVSDDLMQIDGRCRLRFRG